MIVVFQRCIPARNPRAVRLFQLTTGRLTVDPSGFGAGTYQAKQILSAQIAMHIRKSVREKHHKHKPLRSLDTNSAARRYRLLDFANSRRWIEILRAGFGTIHYGMASVKTERIL